MQFIEKTRVPDPLDDVLESTHQIPESNAGPVPAGTAALVRNAPETMQPMPTEEPLEEPAAPPAALNKRKLAEILVDIAEDTSRERVSVADLLLAMQDRAFGALMLIFAMPNAIPTPPGTSAILGAPLVFLAAQLTFGMKPWLPRVIADRSMLRSDFAAMIGKAAPWIAWAERALKPRMTAIARPPAEYAIGAACLLMATILILPIPLGNMLPAFAICLFSLGLLERDGIWILAGLASSIVATVLVSGVVFGMLKLAFFVIQKTFG